MTQKAFMTDKCWLDMTPNLFEGYRLLPFLQDNQQWYAIEIVDGFGAHLNNYEVLRLQMAERIIIVKEEGDSSSINQAYNKFVAKGDKREQRETLGMLREMQGSNNCLTQWSLIQVGLSAIWYTS